MRTVFNICGIVLAVLALAAVAAPSIAQEVTAQLTTREGMPVKVANRTIIILRGPIAGYTAKERATAAMERIEDTLSKVDLPQVTMEDIDVGTRVLVGGKLAFIVTGVDIDKLSGETTRLVASAAVLRLQGAIVEWREYRTSRYLAIATGMAIAVTALYCGILWLIFHIYRWIATRLSSAAAVRSRKLVVGGTRVLNVRHVLISTQALVAGIAWVIAIILTIVWLTSVLTRFPFTRPWGEDLSHNVLDIVKSSLLAIVSAVPGLLFVALIVTIAYAIVRSGHWIFTKVEQGALKVHWLDADTARPTRRIFNIVIWLFALAMSYPYLPGAQTEAFKGLSVLVGLVVSIGASGVVGHAFSGLILMYTRAFRRGDFVRIGDNEGTVVELGTFMTRIRTGLGEEISLPNSMVMGNSTKNYSRAVPGTGFVVDTVVTVGYSAPWRQVHAMLEEAARRTPGIASTPPPFVRQTALSDFYIEYRLVAYTPVETPMQRADILNQLHATIQDVFNEHGVQLMSPHYLMDPAQPKIVPKELWHAPPAPASNAEAPKPWPSA